VEIEELPPDMKDQLIKMRHLSLLEYTEVMILELNTIGKKAYVNSQYHPVPRNRLLRDYYSYKELRDIKAYLKMIR